LFNHDERFLDSFSFCSKKSCTVLARYRVSLTVHHNITAFFFIT